MSIRNQLDISEGEHHDKNEHQNANAEKGGPASSWVKVSTKTASKTASGAHVPSELPTCSNTGFVSSSQLPAIADNVCLDSIAILSPLVGLALCRLLLLRLLPDDDDVLSLRFSHR